jgi:glycosyltransferase involved in cell wall biosynthesis
VKIAILTTDNRESDRKYSALMPYFGTAPEALLQGFAGLPELEVHVISGTRQPMKSPEKLALNTWFHSFYVPRLGWTPTMFQGCVRAVRKLLKKIQPDIVHGQGTERDCSLSAVFSGFPNVLTIHGNMRLIAAVNHAPMISFYRMAATLEGLVLPRTDGVVCITKYTQDAVKDLARKTWVRPNAVDASFFNIQPAPDPEHLILFAGVICLRKNQNAFIRAMDELAATHRFKIIFLGLPSAGDPYAAEFFELLKTRPWCEFTGFVSRDALKNWLQRATMLALPSLEDNCPMVVLEAMAARVPVVAANVGGVPELVSDNQTGLLCDPLNAASIREGVRKILDDDALVKRLTTTAKEQAIAKYHPLTIAREHVKIYREVLSGRGK